MNLFPVSPVQKREVQCHDDGTKTMTLHVESIVVTVTCNRPSSAALEQFTHTLHEILLNLLDDSTQHGKGPDEKVSP
ncbi:hypothetical protein [Ferroacidibacillus organovorans]|uniref:Uncharacterized protein n=1 Tax=Ferroacidibacillus organovorans TaxID=1765683 RepID=A0A101XQR5_9BACL|nr:hypothetical protein [Ferroacidibacillus organovorans]KUO95818.1 hypothetical protein ATW55_15090 [Ferroacidibacillus organovorans]